MRFRVSTGPRRNAFWAGGGSFVVFSRPQNSTQALQAVTNLLLSLGKPVGRRAGACICLVGWSLCARHHLDVLCFLFFSFPPADASYDCITYTGSTPTPSFPATMSATRFPNVFVENTHSPWHAASLAAAGIARGRAKAPTWPASRQKSSA